MQMPTPSPLLDHLEDAWWRIRVPSTRDDYVDDLADFGDAAGSRQLDYPRSQIAAQTAHPTERVVELAHKRR